MVTAELISRARAGDGDAFRELTEPHRRELLVHCYRMLGSLQDAEDALQDTLLAAWQGIGRFEGRASIRTWLYRIATNRCIDLRRSASRRPAKEWDVPEVKPPEPTRLGEVVWLQPFPDALLEGVIDLSLGPEVRYEHTESISLAFVTALQVLPSRQLAVLILRDVLGFHATDDTRPLGAWLFRIAHNRCIDFLRRRGTREQAEADAAVAEADSTTPVEPVGPALGKAVEHLVLTLPPKERACVLLKDVFDYSLEEIADLVGSTVGGVKAALNRGRSKLAERPTRIPSPRPRTTEDAALLRLYVERFNARDWDGLRELIAADARLVVADRFVGRLADSGYFGVYERMPVSWRLTVGEVDGKPVVIVEHTDGRGPGPRTPTRLHISGGRIVGITDYFHCPWVLSASETVPIHRSS